MESQIVGLTHINIRQSIAILLFRLTLIDLVMAVVIIGFYFFLSQNVSLSIIASIKTELFFFVFGTTGLIKILMTIWIVLKWLYEYYEITPDYIVHKKGVIFRKTEEYRLDHVRMMDIQETLIGELLNFATITLFDTRLNKYLDLYLIHNPRRYTHVIKALRPDIELKKDNTVLPFLANEDEMSVVKDD